MDGKIRPEIASLFTASPLATEVAQTEKIDYVDVQEPLSSSASASKDPGPLISKWRFTFLSISLCLCLFLSFIDASIVSTALFTIGTQFKSATTVFWVASAYTLADVAFAVPFTAIADIIGRFRAYLLALIIYFVFSIACGFAQTLNQLIAFRALQGLGGSGLYALTVVIWPELCTTSQKFYLGAAVGMVLAIAGAVGPLLGGAITSEASWRWIFWFKAPVAALALVIFVLTWPRDGKFHHHEARGIRALDWVGCLLEVGLCVLVTFAFQEAGSRPRIWDQALFLAPLLVGCCLLGLLVCWELYIARRSNGYMVPIFPPDLLKTRRYTAAAINTVLTGFGIFIVIYVIPLRLQGVDGKSAVEAGIALLPLLGSSALGSFVSGGSSFKKDMLGWTSIVGSALMALGTGLLSTLQATSHVPNVLYGYQVLVGLGFGMQVSSASILATVECELEHHAVAQGIVSQARVFGGSLGIAAASAILGHEIQKQLAVVAPGQSAASLLATVTELTPAELAVVRQVYSNSFRQALIVACTVTCVSFLAALGTWNHHKGDLFDRVAAQERRESDRLKSLAQKDRSQQG